MVLLGFSLSAAWHAIALRGTCHEGGSTAKHDAADPPPPPPLRPPTPNPKTTPTLSFRICYVRDAGNTKGQEWVLFWMGVRGGKRRGGPVVHVFFVL